MEVPNGLLKLGRFGLRVAYIGIALPNFQGSKPWTENSKQKKSLFGKNLVKCKKKAKKKGTAIGLFLDVGLGTPTPPRSVLKDIPA